jgi:hypothetical protein
MSDIVHAQRAGFVAGLRASKRGRWTPAAQAEAETRAAQAYPITRPRVIRTPVFEYKIEDGQLMNRYIGPRPTYRPSFEYNWKVCHLRPETLRELLDLFKNPTEVVE